MFGLIPLVATIVLAGIVIAANAFLGGDIFSEGGVSAKANTFINEGNQIRNGADVYRLYTSVWPDAINKLTDPGTNGDAGAGDLSYLKAEPTYTFSISGTDGKVTATTTDNAELVVAVCNKIQKSATGTEPASPPAAEPTDQLFGCYGSGPYTFFHK